MQSQDLSDDHAANGLGGQAGQGADLPGFLGEKLGHFTAQAAPDSFADIQARLGARRRKALWLWTVSALLLGGLLTWLWQGKSPSTGLAPIAVTVKTSAPTEATGNKAHGTAPDIANSPTERPVAQIQEAPPAASVPNTSIGGTTLANQKPEPTTNSQVQPQPADLSSTPANPQPGLGRQAVASATQANRVTPATVSKGASVPGAEYESTPEVAGKSAVPEAAPKQAAPKGAVHAFPAGEGNSTLLSTKATSAEEQAALEPAQTEAPSSAKPTAASEASAASLAMHDADLKTAPAAPGDSVHLNTGSQDTLMAKQPVPVVNPVPAKADSALVAPATVTPTKAISPSRWQIAFGGGAGIFNRRVLVPNAARKELEPNGLKGGLALSLQSSLGYCVASGLHAELGLGLLHGQAILSQRQYHAGGGIAYQAIDNGFAGTPVAPVTTVNTPLTYTLASMEAGLAWQPGPRWSACVRGGVQQTLRQQAPVDGTALPMYTFPVGAALMRNLAGPVWAGAAVTYFSSGAGQSGSAALFMLEYRIKK